MALFMLASAVAPLGIASRPGHTLAVVTCPDSTPVPTPTFATVRVAAVVDGDTVSVADAVAPGSPTATYEVRYLCIDAPEEGRPCAREAAAANATLVADHDVQLDTDRTDRDVYGRRLRYVFVDDPDTGERVFVNEELVRQGWVRVDKIAPDVIRCGDMKRLEAEARAGGRGCWPVARKAWPQLGQVAHFPFAVRNLRLADLPRVGTPRPPTLKLDDLQCVGDDEYIRIANRAAEPIDLNHWSLVSATSVPLTYTFASQLLSAGDAVCVHSGPDARPDAFPDLRWTLRHVWNDDGDTARLLDPSAGLIDERTCFDP